MATELSYGPYYQPSTGKFANQLPEIVGVSDIDNKPMYGNWVEGFTPVDVDNDPQFREYYSWTPTTFANTPLAIALNRAADQSNFQAPYRGSILQMLEAYAPIMGLSPQANWKQIFTDTQNRQFRSYGNWSTYDNPSQTFFKFLQWNNFPNASKVQQYVQSTPEYQKEARSFTDAWNASNKSSGSFFDDLLGVGSIAVAFMFPELAGFIGEAMGFGAATSTAAMVAGNAVMSAGVAAVEGKSPDQILKAAATGALGGVAQQAAIGSNSFLQSMMDAGVPWDIVQSIPKAGIGSLAGAVTSALQGKDVLSGLVTGGSLSLLGGSITNALTSSGVSPLMATAAAQSLNQLILNGEINPEALAKNAALGVIDPQVSKTLQDAGIPTEAIPTAVRAVNQVLTTGQINPESLALAATGQFAADQLKGGLPGATETTPIPEQEVIPSTPLPPEPTQTAEEPTVQPPTSPLATVETPTEPAKSGLDQVAVTTPEQAPTETTAEQPSALDQAAVTTPSEAETSAPTDTTGGLTQVATGPTMTDVPVQEKNWGEPGYVYPDGTVEPEPKPAEETTPAVTPDTTGGLPVDQTLVDAYVNPQTPTTEVTQQPVTPEDTQTTTGGLPTPIEQQIADQGTQVGGGTLPETTGTDVGTTGGLPVTPSDPYAGDPNALIPVTTDTGTVYVDPNTGDVASDPTQVVTDPYFTTNPSTADLGGETTTPPKGGTTTPTVPKTPTGGTTTPSSTTSAISSGLGALSIPWLDTSPELLRNIIPSKNKTPLMTKLEQISDIPDQNDVLGGLQFGMSPAARRAQSMSPVEMSDFEFASGGSTTSSYDSILSCKYAPQFTPAEASILQTSITGKKSPLTMQQLKQLQAQISAHGNMGGLAQGGLPKKYQDAAPDGHNPEFITGLTGYYADGRGTGQSDDIPALLHDGDYVMDAETVSALGDGSSKAGREVLDGFREKIPHSKATGGHVVPAKIADGEYVFPAEFVTALGSGDNKRGAAILDGLREKLRAHKRAAPLSKIPPKAKSPLEYIEKSKR